MVESQDIQNLPQEKKPLDNAQGKPLRIGKIIVDRSLCIGAASCIAVAPGVF